MRVRLSAAALLVLSPAAALAAGGAHVIDDVEVETPGHCHFETWVTRDTSSQRLLNLGPACTRVAWPNLEIGATLQHLDPGRFTEVSFGPAIKVELRAPDHRLGVAVDATVGWSTRTDRIETAGVIVPLTLDVGDRLRVNANGGWLWTHTRNVHSGFVGGQAEFAAAAEVSLMAEVFDRLPGRAGGQAGVRWTPRDWLDLDLLGGRYVDGSSKTAVTFGVTVRH